MEVLPQVAQCSKEGQSEVVTMSYPLTDAAMLPYNLTT